MIDKRPAAKQAPWILCAAALLLGACSADTSEATGGAAQGVAVEVTPGAAWIAPTQTMPFTAAVTGTANVAVTWSVAEGSAGGTVDADGLYTAPAATGTFRVVATSQADPSVTGSATVTVSDSPPPAGALMTTAHRTSGVAPLSVFFDAVDTTPAGTASPFTWRSGVVQPADFEGTLYEWDFGDPGAGTFSTTGRSKNTATGYTAAHVYESPGTFTATLRVTDATGTVRSYSQVINVTPFTGTTYYVAATGSDSASGTSTATPFQTVHRAMTVALAASGPVRVLFRRGDTFPVTSSYAINKAGPGIIGAYGSGAKPLLTVPDLGDVNVFSPRGAGADWRIMDLEMRGPSADQASWTGSVGPPPDSQGVNSLFLRLSLNRWNVALGWGLWGGPAAGSPHDGITIAECELWNHYNVGLYVGGRRLALLGNYDRDGIATHLVRVWQAHKGVISNNRLLRPGGQRHAIKLHGPEPAFPSAPHTRWVTISDDEYEGSATSQWTVSIGSQSNDPSEASPVSHVVIERTRFLGSPSTVVDIESEASNAMVRNNVFDDTRSPGAVSILWNQRNPGVPTPNDVRIYNNTTYQGSAGGGGLLQTNSTASNLRVRNNLYGAASLSAVSMIQGAGGAGWAADHNLATASPGFVNPGAGDFSLSAGSPAVNAGVVLPDARNDLAGNPRPRGTTHDLGAVESF